MKIRTQFYMTAAFSSLVLLLIAGSLIFTNLKLKVLNEQVTIAVDIERRSSELDYLSNDYLNFQDDQKYGAWKTEWSALSGNLAKLKISNTKDQKIMESVEHDIKGLHNVFDSVVASLESRNGTESERSNRVFKQVAWSRLAVYNQGLFAGGHKLTQSLRDQRDDLRHTNSMLIYILLGSFGAYFVMNYLVVNRRIFKSLADLHQGTQVIGTGKFDHEIPVRYNDEIGELAGAFNLMTSNLKDVTASKEELELEIAERIRAQEALYEERERLAVTLGSIGDGVIATDEHANIVMLNTVAEELTGWTHKEAQGKPLLEVFNIVNEVTRELAEDPVAKALSTGNIVGLANHTALIRKDGSEHSIADSCAPIKDRDGTIIGAVLVFRDVTEQYTAERLSEALNEISAAISSTLDFDEIMRTVVVKAGQAVNCHVASIEMLKDCHWEVSYIYGLPGDLIGTRFSFDEAKGLQLALDKREPFFINGDNVRKLLTPRVIDSFQVKSMMIMPIILKNKVIAALRFVDQESTQIFDRTRVDFAKKLAASLSLALENARLYETEKEIASKLHEERERLAITLGSIGDGVIATDMNANIVMVNKVAEDLTGWTQKEAKGRPLMEIFNIINEMTRKPAEDPVNKALTTGRIVGLANHTALIAKDGSERSIADSCAPIQAKDGSIIGAVLVFRDVTEQYRAQKLQDALNEISKAIGSTLDFDKIMETVVVQAARAVNCHSTSIEMRSAGYWEIRYLYGLPNDMIGKTFSFESVKGLEMAVKLKEPFFLSGKEVGMLLTDEVVEAFRIKSMMIMPIVIKGEVVAALRFVNRESSLAFSEAEIDFSRNLAASVSLALENARLYATEHHIAKTLQEALIRVPQALPGVEFGHLYRSASEAAQVGGDFYDVFEIESGKIGIIIGDVAGKGVSAATLTVLVESSIKTLAHQGFAPSEIMRQANNIIKKETKPTIFVTLFFGILDTATGELRYCSGGHPPAIIRKNSSRIVLLKTNSPVVGAMEGITYYDGVKQLDKDDVLIIYTDGVTEARQGRQLFGETRLIKLIEDLDELSPTKLPQHIYNKINKFSDGQFVDDLALLTLSLSDPKI